MKSFVFLFFVLLIGCEYSDIHKVCVNYLESDSVCGTGFFVESDVLLTAYHVVAKTKDNVLTVVGPGVNKTSHTWDCDEDADICEIYFDEEITEHFLPVCKNIPSVGAEVDVVGYPGFKRKIRTTIFNKVVEDFSNDHQIMFLEFENDFVPGFSGGPVIAVNYGCVFGMALGMWGYDLSKGKGLFLENYGDE